MREGKGGLVNRKIILIILINLIILKKSQIPKVKLSHWVLNYWDLIRIIRIIRLIGNFTAMTHRELIDNLIKSGYLKTPRIINALKKNDRQDFVPEDLKHEAYINAPLPIGFGQTISQPLTVAFMLELLQPEEGNKILDVGSGSGWQTAMLAEIVGPPAGGGKIFAVEILEKLSEFGKKNIEKYDFVEEGRVEFVHTDGSFGLPEKAPFDRIIAAAAAEAIPEIWKTQLKIGGRLVAPVGSDIILLVKKNDNEFEEKKFSGFAFVPLVSDAENKKYQWEKDFLDSPHQV